MEEHPEERVPQPAGPDEGLLRQIHQAGGDLWAGVRSRASKRIIACLASSQAVCWGALWPFRGEAPGMAAWGSVAWAIWVFLCLNALGMGVALAAIDSLQALVADGPLLARLGRLLRPPDPGRPSASPGEQFAAFGSPQALSRAARLSDLPLVVFLVRVVLGVDAKRLLVLAQGGADREIVLRELVRLAQARTAAALRRARLIVWAILGLMSALTALILWLITR